MLHQLIKRTDFCRFFQPRNQAAFFISKAWRRYRAPEILLGSTSYMKVTKNRSGAVFGWEERSVLLDVSYSKQLAIHGRTTL